MKAGHSLLRCGVLLLALAASRHALAGSSPRDAILSAKQAATDANFRNDPPGLSAALATFVRHIPDPTSGQSALYHAAWTEWMLAASHFDEQRPAEALAALDSGIARLRRALAAHPDDGESHGLLAWMLLAVASGDRARAPEIFPAIREHRQRALALAPRSPRVVMLDATLLFYAGRPDAQTQGLARWQEALQLVAAESRSDSMQPDWGRTLADGWLANLLLSLNPPDFAGARAHAEKALRERPDFWWVTTRVLPRLPPS